MIRGNRIFSILLEVLVSQFNFNLEIWVVMMIETSGDFSKMFSPPNLMNQIHTD